MCPNSDSTSPCNRRPFVSEDGCDRGSVDVHQFDDFPYCEPINPTPPGIPPEIDDGPIPIPIPTYTCSCINISYKLDFRYNKEKKFKAHGSFSAKGDCCEGNYETGMSFEIPCPINAPKGRKIKVGISYGKDFKSDSASFIAANSDSCTIEALSPSLHLEIPCPVNDSEGKKLKIGISYGNGPQSASASFIKANPDSCTIEALSPDIRLNIPCPVKDSEGKKIKVGISYGEGPTSASASFIDADTEDCAIKPKNADIRINIPCPVKDSEGRRIKVGISYGDGPKSASASFIKADPEKCEIEPLQANLHINIPCPVIGDGGTKKIKAKIKYGDGASASASFLKMDKDACAVEAFDANLDLSIPCPVKSKGTKKLKLQIKLGDSTVSASASYASMGDSCSINMQDVNLNLNLPCPVKATRGEKKIKATIGYGSNGSASATFASIESGCDINIMDEVNLELKVPCPVKGETGTKKIKATIGYGEGNSSASASYASVGDSCSITLKDEVSLDLKIPCPVKSTSGEKKIKTKIEYGSGPNEASVAFAKVGDSCSVEILGEEPLEMSLNIPCPIKGVGGNGDKNIKANIAYGDNFESASATFANVDEDCKIEVKESVTLDMHIPCPIKSGMLEFEGSAETTDSSQGDVTITDEDTEQSGCARKVKVKVKFPRAMKNMNVVTGLRYSGNKMQYQTTNLKTGTKSGWKTIFSTVSHKSDHVNCNDA